MEQIIERVILSSEDDESRFRTIIDAAIAAGEVPNFPAYAKGLKKKKNKKQPSKKQNNRSANRKRKSEEISEETEESTQPSNGQEANGDLLQMISQNASSQASRFNSLIAGYANLFVCSH